MHELSIVEALVAQVQCEVDRSGQAGSVRRIGVNIGQLSGVNCDSVRFAYQLLVPGTPLDGAELDIHESRAELHCLACSARVEAAHAVLHCPECASHDVRIEGGADLSLETIEIADWSGR